MQFLLYSTVASFYTLILLGLSIDEIGNFIDGSLVIHYPTQFILYFILFLLVLETLNCLPWKKSVERKMRIAFIITFFHGVILEVIKGILLNHPVAFFNIFSNFSGSFVAALLFTHREWSLIEVNFPPSIEIKKEIIEKHIFSLGTLSHNPHSKRVFDIVVSSLGLIILSPLWVLFSILIWLEDPGPIIFCKVCVGRAGRSFKLLKFRTMIKNAESKTGPVLAPQNDARILHIGKILRKTALDELPELLNILRGEMSIVGPRPQRSILVYEYIREIPNYVLRHKIKPGLTGMAQIYGHYYITPRQKLRFDLLYLKRRSFLLDIKLFLLSFLFTFRGGWQNRSKSLKTPLLLKNGKRIYKGL